MAHIAASLFKTPLPFAKVVSDGAAKLRDCRLRLSPQGALCPWCWLGQSQGSKVRSGRACLSHRPSHPALQMDPRAAEAGKRGARDGSRLAIPTQSSGPACTGGSLISNLDVPFHLWEGDCVVQGAGPQDGSQTWLDRYSDLLARLVREFT